MTLPLNVIAAVFRPTGIHNPQTKTGWASVCASTPPVRPAPITKAKYAKLSEQARADYNLKRDRFHASLTQIRTPQMIAAHAELDRAFARLQSPSFVARFGVMLSGETQAGKSTIAIKWGMEIDRLARQAQQMPPLPGQPVHRIKGAQSIPVAYLSATNSLGGTLRNALSFYEAAVPNRIGVDHAIDWISKLINDCNTCVVIIDQMQEIGSAKNGPGVVSAGIKAIMDRCPRTMFVGAGIGIEDLHIFTDGHSIAQASLGQTGGRFACLPIPSMRPHDPASAAAWSGLLTTLENTFMLFDHQPGDIAHVSDYILDRTDGRTGAVIQLLRDAATYAINDPTVKQERITEAVLSKLSVSASADLKSGHIQSTTRRGAA